MHPDKGTGTVPPTPGLRTPWAVGTPAAARRQPLRFLFEVLRGIAQVDFLPNAASGALFVAALFAAGPLYGLYGLLGSAVGTGTARLLGVDRERVSAGLEGFNSTLTATTCAVILGPGRLSTLLLAAGAAVVTAVLTGALHRVLAAWDLPTLTVPFCLALTGITLAAPGLRRLWHDGTGTAALPGPATGDTALGWGDLWHAFFANVGQIFLMPQWYVGLLFLAGIFAADLTAGLAAALGSVVGILTAWVLGIPATDVAHGLIGYNAVLTAMALSCVFLTPGRRSLGYAVLGAATATLLTPALTNLLAPSGGHVFTWPFVLTTLLFLVAVPAFPKLRRS